MLDLLYWALRVVIMTFVLLLLSILLWFVFDKLMGLLGGQTLSYFDVAVVTAIISVGVGSWSFTLLRRTTTQ